MPAKKIEVSAEATSPTIDALGLDIAPETPQVVHAPVVAPAPIPAQPTGVPTETSTGIRIPNIKCSRCTWIGGDMDLKNRSYLNDLSPYFKTANPEDLFCPTCGERLVEVVRAAEDSTYAYYGYDFENRKKRIIAREVRVRSLDPDAYDATRRRELAKHGIQIPRD